MEYYQFVRRVALQSNDQWGFVVMLFLLEFGVRLFGFVWFFGGLSFFLHLLFVNLQVTVSFTVTVNVSLYICTF